MDYKYRKNQIFGKRLKVPKDILNMIYNSKLPGELYFKYNLEDKIPISCVRIEDRQLLERFGIEKCKTLDWELVSGKALIENFGTMDQLPRLMRLDPQTEDLNMAIYEQLKDEISPIEYTEKMKKVYSSRLIEEKKEDFGVEYLFNRGRLRLDSIIDNWDKFKDKDLDYCLSRDSRTKGLIKSEPLKYFMNEWRFLIPIIKKNDDLYEVLKGYFQLNHGQDRFNYMMTYQKTLLEKTIEQRREFNFSYHHYTNDEYKILFTIIRPSTYFDMVLKNNTYSYEEGKYSIKLAEELKNLPEDYIYNMPFPISELADIDSLNFISRVGLKNVVDFENECGPFLFKRGENNILELNSILSSYEDIQTKEDFYNWLREKLPEAEVDYRSLKGEFRELFPEIFISEEAPEEMKNAFYLKTITPGFIAENPDICKYLKNKEWKMNGAYLYINGKSYTINAFEFIKEKTNEDIAFEFLKEYGEALETTDMSINMFSFDCLPYVNLDDDIDAVIDEIDNNIKNVILNTRLKYPKIIPKSFKTKYPTMVLRENVAPELSSKFYDRTLSYKDLDNPEFLEIMKTTNIICGFPGDYSWIIPMFEESDSIEKANYKRMKVASAFSRINDLKLREQFREYVKKRIDTIDLKNIDNVQEVLSRLEYSNSIELSSFKESMAVQLLESDNPIEKLDMIEDVFLRNNLPLCGKMFLVFEIIYPELSAEKRFDFRANSRVAPQLKDESLPDVGFHVSDDGKRKIITFNDLLRISIRSNERSLIEYLNNIEKGNELYLSLKNNNFDISNLTNEEIKVLEIFASHLETLRQNTKKGKEESIDLENSTLEEKLKVLSKEFQETGRHDLKDRIVRSFCYYAGIKSFDELKSMIDESNKEQEDRINNVLESIDENGGKFKIEEGDFVRCIGNIEVLNGSLKTGNYCKEHLGSFFGTSKSDTTPLDVDISTVSDTSNLPNAILNSPTGYGFGNIFVFMKKDNPNLNITRDSEGNLTGAKYEPQKIEMFGTKVAEKGYETHWGARTGIALADVDCIMYKEAERINLKNPFDENGNVNYEQEVENKGKILKQIKFEITKNGHYIPVIDFSGKLVFTKEEFIELRDKMQGLSYYGINDYKLSDELINPEIEKIADSLTQDSIDNTIIKREKINTIIKEVLDDMGISMKDIIDGDLSPNSVEFVDTGSTGRGTNIPYDGDFDFFMRLDASLIKNKPRFKEFREKLIKKIGQYEYEELKSTNHDDLRYKNVKIDEDTIVDIDISFGIKTNKVRYSTDECIRDRLETIKKLYPDQYKYVVANIIRAKELLKDPKVNAYKPRRSDKEQGGLGGVGIENWILQNGGSFVEACKTFIEAATDMHGDIVPFDDFKEKYFIWNFGENHFAVRDGKYPHNNFVADNMNENGYQKMANALKEYMKTIEISKSDNESKTMT